MSAEEIKEAYQKLFLDEAGGLKPHARIVLEDLLGFTKLFSDAKLSPERPADSLLILEGSRSVVRRLLKMSGAGGQTLKRLLEGD
jgi:hypothetical protein